MRARFMMEVSLISYMSRISEELYIVLCWYALSVNAWVDTVCMDILSWWNLSTVYTIGMSCIATILGVTCTFLCAARTHGMVS